MNSYSQFQEDLWIQENLKPEPGVFCEVGAYDGIACSNTLAFEELGWTGILIEPDPLMAAKCRENRPKCQVWCCACGFNQLSEFHINQADRGSSGLTRSGFSVPVIVWPWHELLMASGFRKLDLLSIDTEGTEMDVWTASWISYPVVLPKIIVIAYKTWELPSCESSITLALDRNGYRQVHKTEVNLIFVKK